MDGSEDAEITCLKLPELANVLPRLRNNPDDLIGEIDLLIPEPEAEAEPELEDELASDEEAVVDQLDNLNFGAEEEVGL